MQFFYSFSLKFYHFLIWLISFKNEKAKRWINGRKNVFENIESKKDDEFVIWMHCASLGEFEQGKPVIEELLKKVNNSSLILSFFSPSGYEYKKDYHQAKRVLYLPLDSKQNARKWFDAFEPNMFLSIKYEIWPFYLAEARKRSIPSFLISATFRKSQVYFSIFGSFFRSSLKCFENVMVQDQSSLLLLEKFGIESVVTGDTRFDRVAEIKNEKFEDNTINDFVAENEKVVVFGSTYSQEHKWIQGLINKKISTNYKFIIAPHNLDENALEELDELFPTALKYSNYQQEQVKSEILIIDTIGLLSRIYRYAMLAYVGGGFGGGLHNSLEAVAYGIPVLVGPNHRKFHEVQTLIDQNGILELKNENEFNNKIIEILNSSKLSSSMGNTNRDYTHQMKGATEKSVSQILNKLNV